MVLLLVFNLLEEYVGFEYQASGRDVASRSAVLTFRRNVLAV
jgi:hypothetical protein